MITFTISEDHWRRLSFIMLLLNSPLDLYSQTQCCLYRYLHIKVTHVFGEFFLRRNLKSLCTCDYGPGGCWRPENVAKFVSSAKFAKFSCLFNLVFSPFQAAQLPNASGSRTTNRCGLRPASSPSPTSLASPDWPSTRPRSKITVTTRWKSPTSRDLPGRPPNSKSNVSHQK